MWKDTSIVFGSGLNTDELFANGQIAMEQGWWGSQFVPGEAAIKGKFKWDFVPMPKGPGNVVGTQLTINGIAMSSITKEPDATWTYMKWLLDPVSQVEIVTGGGGRPAPRHALLLNQRLRGTHVFRTLFFLPSLTPAVASALLWQWLFQPNFGPINYLLSLAGVANPPLWFSDQHLAMPGLMIMTLWGAIGGGTMIIFLAGLQGVPAELHEAAAMDGAGVLRRFYNVTLPMITPTIFFNLVIGIIGALRTFATAFVATNGGPHYATWFYILHLYQTAFQNFDMGYASALAWIFFVIVIFFTTINVRLSRHWVYYEGETR